MSHIIVKSEPERDPGDEGENCEAPVAGTPTLRLNLRPIRDLLDSATDAAALEQAMILGQAVIAEISPLISQLAALDVNSTARKDDVRDWENAIAEIQDLARPTRDIIGVVGATGAGKSSLVNAILDEEQFLPTSCLQACTACVTEISYNYDGDESAAYTAEIEFIPQNDWHNDIQKCLREITDSLALGTADYTNPDTDAGSAFLKLTAVYPNLGIRDIPGTQVATLLADSNTQRVLGSTIKLKDVSSNGIFNQVQSYIQTQRKGRDSQAACMNHWPLIKVVRMFTKATALKTGAVLVDLPGSHDSNSARAAVATEYIDSCTGLWVVAPIARAMDDKSARYLLGESFRQQMMFDIKHSAVTFICSKTDDIKVYEAVENLELPLQYEGAVGKSATMTQEIHALANELSDVKEQKSALRDQIDAIRDKIDGLSSEKGTDTASPVLPAKRDRSSLDPVGNEPTETDQLEASKNELKSLRHRLATVNENIDDRERALLNARLRKEEHWGRLKEACVRERNRASTLAIQTDFGQCIRENDQAKAAAEDEAFANPDEDRQDYRRIAENLPVFCASSHVYQRLRGRLATDDVSTSGFPDAESTLVPALQRHAQKMTASTRVARCRQALSRICVLLYAISCWIIGSDVVKAGLDPGSIRQYMAQEFGTLKAKIQASKNHCGSIIHLIIETTVVNPLTDLLPNVPGEAIRVARRWFVPRAASSYSYTTFKSLCKNDGQRPMRRNAAAINLQAELLHPILAQIGPDWRHAFIRAVPKALEQLAMDCMMHVQEFKARVEERYSTNGEMASALDVFAGQTETMRGLLSGMSFDVKELLRKRQQIANKKFEPAVRDAMLRIYSAARDIQGPGAHKRLKTLVVSELESCSPAMFRSSVSAVQTSLQLLESSIDSKICKDLGNYLKDLESGATGALTSVAEQRKLREGEVKPRQDLLDIFSGVPRRFAHLADAS
ncbi:Nuclear GTPase SLIP-GC [Colletotrichum orbiculare MAFF 240422]|uniref:Nuclear GTPase SLIP-GC n=1 Tax=Colletotrichum orbiculare (strain 104-T / ATCC 96160 / CBS 514.97 / LARS 414 / MAFF 240422) TaxID=1213857 RepID=N4VDC3_COLOR|nr:Nuclear GTPase SLIP-GC [Colletotrichum orbiculare MAFF 240422]